MKAEGPPEVQKSPAPRLSAASMLLLSFRSQVPGVGRRGKDDLPAHTQHLLPGDTAL